MKKLSLISSLLMSIYLLFFFNISASNALIYGINEHQLFDKEVAVIKDLGVSMLRIGFEWGKLEESKGVFDFTKPDNAYKKAKDNNIQVLGLLGYTAKWASSDPTGAQDKMYPAKDFQDYFNFVGKMVERYPEIKYWEVWNEPNIDSFWKPEPNASEYARMLKGAYKVIKAKNPEAKVVMAGTAMTDINFLRKVYDAGAKNSFDILAIHPYRSASPTEIYNWTGKTFEGELSDLRKLMENYGDSNKKIWITEMGYSTKSAANWPYAVTEEKQSEHLKNIFDSVKKFPSVEALFWYELRDSCDVLENNPSWEHCGIGLLNYDFSHKKAFDTYKNIIKPVSPRVEPEICKTFVYSNWSSCTNNVQTRTVVSSVPTGCEKGNPQLVQGCNLPNTNFSFTQNLVLGSDNEDVRQLQIILNSDLDTSIVPPGPKGNGSKGKEGTYFGNATKDAVQRFQKKYEILPVNGFVWESTREVLNKILKGQSVPTKPADLPQILPSTPVLPEQSKPKETFVFLRDLTLGSNNKDVKQLQIILNSDPDTAIISIDGNGSKGKETMFFGLATKDAVLRFQKKYRIVPGSGFVGSQTRIVLNMISSGGVPSITDEASVELRINNQTGTIIDNSPAENKSFEISWTTNGKLTSCKSLSVPTVANWNGDAKPFTGKETIRIANQTATTTLSLTCNVDGISYVSSRIDIIRKIDKTPDTVKPVALRFTVNDANSYTGTSSRVLLSWNSDGANSCIGMSDAGILRWNKDSKFLSGLESVKLATGTTSFIIKCSNNSTSTSKTVTVNVLESNQSEPTATSTEFDRVKIITPAEGATVIKETWKPVSMKIKAGITTPTRLKLKLEGPFNTVTGGTLSLGQFTLSPDNRVYDCGLAQSDSDRMMLCDSSGLQIRLSAGTLNGTYRLRVIDADDATKYWIGPKFQVVKSTAFVCPQYTPPAPGWCSTGKIVQQLNDANGCAVPPKCVVNAVTSIKIISPNGGEIWKTGSTQTIKWLPVPGYKTILDLIDMNAGHVSFVGLGKDIFAEGVGSYTTNIPTDMPSGKYSIRVIMCPKDNSDLYCSYINPDTSNSDSSDATFTISSVQTQLNCTAFEYSPWTTCSNGRQTRTITSKTPIGCTGGSPLSLDRSCSVEPITCTTFSYSDWSSCIGEQQTRTVLTKSPVGCSGGIPMVRRACTTAVEDSLRMISPIVDQTIPKKTFTNFKFQVLSGFVPSKTVRLVLIRDNEERYVLGTVSLGSKLGNCVAETANAVLVCDGTMNMQVKILGVVPTGTYRLKLISGSEDSKDTWSVGPIYITPYAGTTLENTTKSATVSDSGFWEYFKKIVK